MESSGGGMMTTKEGKAAHRERLANLLSEKLITALAVFEANTQPAKGRVDRSHLAHLHQRPRKGNELARALKVRSRRTVGGVDHRPRRRRRARPRPPALRYPPPR